MKKTPVTQEDRFYRLAFCCFFLVAAIIRFPFIFQDSLWSDEGLYSWFGKRIFTDPFVIFSPEITASHPPLFSVFLAIAHIFFPSPLACHFIPFVFYLLGIVAIYHFGKKIQGSFVGLFAAITLALNYYYFVYSIRILIDGPLMVFCILYATVLLKIHEKNNYLYDIVVGLLGSAIVLLKSSGIIIVPWMLTIYLFGAQGKTPFMSRLKKFFIPFFIVGATIFALLIKNYYQSGTIHPAGPTINLNYFHDFQLLLSEIYHLINSPFLLSLFFIGLISSGEKNNRVVLWSWLGIFFLGLLSGGVKEIRYDLMVLPPVLILCGIGFERVINILTNRLPFLSKKIFKKIVILFLFIFSLILFRNVPNDLSRGEKFAIGYARAGQWVKENNSPNALIIAGSERQIRYYSDVNYKEYGGQIVAFRQNKEDFEKLIQNTNGPVLLVIDVWEVLQPQWAWHVKRQTIDYLKREGFQFRGVVECQNYFGRDQKLGAIFVFRKEGMKRF